MQRGIYYSINISMSIDSVTVNGHCAAPLMRGWHPTCGLLCGTRCAAAIRVGKSALKLPYCCKLGLGVCKISALLWARGQIIGFDNQQRRPRHEPAAPAAARIFSNGGGAAALQVGKSALTLPYCCKLGLGVCKISALL